MIEPKEDASGRGAVRNRLDPALVQAAVPYGAASLHEAAGRTGALPAAIKPVAPGFCVCGPAVTVHAPGGDNLWLHRAIYAAEPGEVLVAFVSHEHEYGYWGEIMAHAAQARRLGGLVIDGCVRDGHVLAALGFPVFARGLALRGTGKDADAPGAINVPVLVGDVTVTPGDLVAGDGDGVVVIPAGRVATTLEQARVRAQREREIATSLAAGARTLDLYGWPDS